MDSQTFLQRIFMLGSFLLNVCVCTKATTISTCYNGTCLTFMNETMNFDNATKLCKSRREEVLFIEDDVTQNNSLHLLGRVGGTVPVWLNMKSVQFSSWKYITTEEEYEDDIEDHSGDCVYLEIGEEGMATKPAATNCQTKKHFICRNKSIRQECKHCFIYNTTMEVTWFTARKLCQDGGGDLDLAFWSKMDFSKSPGLSKLNYGGHFWIGLRKSDWLWQIGEPVKYNNFSGRYPIPGTDCGLLLSDGTWATSHCGDRFGVVCRTPKRNWSPEPSVVMQTTSSLTPIPTIVTSSEMITSSEVMTSQITPQYHKGKSSHATEVLAGTLTACFLVIFIFSFIAFWFLRNKTSKCMKKGKATLEHPQPEIPLEFSNPSFLEVSRQNQRPIAESNYIYIGGPNGQYDVIYTDVTKDDAINKGASTSRE